MPIEYVKQGLHAVAHKYNIMAITNKIQNTNEVGTGVVILSKASKLTLSKPAHAVLNKMVLV